MNPPPAPAPAVCFDASRRSRFRPRPAALLALAGLVAAAAVPTGLLATAASSPTSRAAAHAAQARPGAAAEPGQGALVTATGAMALSAADADGADLARRLAKDAALRRTLAGLQSARAGVLASQVVIGGSVSDIPPVAAVAYQQAATQAGNAAPGCHISWTLVAGIGRVESDHGRYGGSAPAADGEVRPPILGPVLDGTNGNAAIPDTDGGRYDADTRWDRAVGPMQFIPSTWATWGRDGNGDGVRDPENFFDAALATADYLCASGSDLSTPAGAEQSVLSYNHSLDYVLVVLGYASAYGGQDLSPVSAELARYLTALAKAHQKPAKKPTGKAVKKAVARRVAPPRPPTRPVVKPTTRVQPTPRPSPTAGPATGPTPGPTPSSSPTPSPKPSPTPSTSPPPSPPAGAPARA